MLSREENELLTRTGPATAAGDYFRRFWLPALLASEVPTPDCPPVRLRMLGEDLVAFRDTEGHVGLIDEFCPHRVLSEEPCGSLSAPYFCISSLSLYARRRTFWRQEADGVSREAVGGR